MAALKGTGSGCLACSDFAGPIERAAEEKPCILIIESKDHGEET